MGDVIQIERGASPWQPAHDASLVREYQYYEIPLMGLVEQHGIRFLFSCVAGGDEEVSLWVYVRVSDEAEALLDAAKTPEEFNKATGHVIIAPAVMALAVEQLGIVEWQVLDSLTSESIREAHNALVHSLDATLSSLSNEARTLTPA